MKVRGGGWNWGVKTRLENRNKVPVGKNKRKRGVFVSTQGNEMQNEFPILAFIGLYRVS